MTNADGTIDVTALLPIAGFIVLFLIVLITFTVKGAIDSARQRIMIRRQRAQWLAMRETRARERSMAAHPAGKSTRYRDIAGYDWTADNL